MTCTITGTAGLPSGAVYPSATFTFTRLPKTVAAQGNRLVSPLSITTTSNGSGAVSFSLLAGSYSGEVDGVRFPFTVPDAATANFQDCVSAASVTPWPDAVQAAIDARDAALATVSAFPTRASLVTWAAANTPATGLAMQAVGVSYRYIGSGTAISDMPGWVPDGIREPEHDGAVGDGTTNDTIAISRWLSAGGGRAMDPTKTYLIDPMVISANVKVATAATFKQRSGWSDWTVIDGTIKFTGNVEWLGGLADQDRDNATINAGMSAILGTNSANIIGNKYKAFFYVAPAGTGRVVNIDGVTFKNCFCWGLHIEGTATRKVTGKIGKLFYQNSAMAARLLRCSKMTIDTQYAQDMDNRIGASNEVFFPSGFSVFSFDRMNDCQFTGDIIVNGMRGRPGTWFSGADDQFMVAATMTACIDCKPRGIDIRGVVLSLLTASDTGGATMASKTSCLGYSDVSNIRCEFDRLSGTGTFSQGWELIPGWHSNYGDVTIKSAGGEQGAGSGSCGLSIHGSQRPQSNAATGRTQRRYRVRINSVDTPGFGIGYRARGNKVTIGHCRIHASRSHAIQASNGGIIEWGAAYTEVPELTIENADIQWNGGRGLDVVNGGKIKVLSGTVANNCQMSGYDDPAISGGAQTWTEGIAYNSTDTYAGAVESIHIGPAVNTDSDASYSSGAANYASYLPTTPVAGSEATINDARLKFIAMTFKDVNKVFIGQRLQIQDVDAAGVQDVDIWIRDIVGNCALAEVSTAYAGAWSDAVQTTALTGTWTTASLASLLATGTGAALTTDLAGPAFIKAPTGYVLLENIVSASQFYWSGDDYFGATFANTMTANMTAATIYYLKTSFTYTQRQTTRAEITHANVALALDTAAAPDFGSRTAFVAWATGRVPAAQTLVQAGPCAYRYTGSGTAITGLPGWVPHGTATPDHYAENVVPGTTDMTTAFQTVFANHAVVSDIPGSIYLVKGICNVSFDNPDINFERSTIITTGWDVGDAFPAFASGLINVLGTTTKTTTMSGTAAEGATSITVASGTGIGAGDAIFMISSGELWYTEGAGNPCNRSFVTRVTSVSGTTVNLADALPFGFDTGVASVSITTWRGVQGARISMGTMIGPGYVRSRVNGAGENAICALYAQKLTITAKKIVGFQGRSIYAQRCLDVVMDGFVQGRPDSYTSAVVEGVNSYWSGFVAVECARVLMSGHASRTRHAVDGTRSWDVHVTTRASDTHQSPYTCHYGCSNWVFDGVNYNGASVSQGILLWRGWNFKVLGAYLTSTDTSAIIYDTDGTATDLPKTYSIDDCYASGPGDVIALKSVIKDVKIRGSVIKGANSASVAGVHVYSDRVENLDISGNTIDVVGAQYAIDSNATPVLIRNWRVENNNIGGYSIRALRAYAESSQTMLSMRGNMLRPTGTPSDHITATGTFLHLVVGPNYAADGKVHAPLTAWTPILSDGTNNATMSINTTGWYRREGGMIHFVARVEITSLGSVTGGVRIIGLPVNMGATGFASCIVPVGNAGSLAITAGQSVVGYIGAGTNYIQLQLWNATGGVGTMQATNWTATGRIQISGSYPAV